MRSRPTRQQVDPTALELIARHGAQILATARRYAATPEDAEDAYQRAFEILLTKAPATTEQELLPWLKTVVKHEAFALRRQRERHAPLTDDGELADPPAEGADTPDRAERYERLRHGAEALRELKPQEVRALLLKAEGYSYREICQITGWSYTKVNRSLTEGRRAFLRQVESIRAGAECERLAPRLSALADGEAPAADLALLRPHMKSCLACRARLKEFRAAPARVAALVPPAAAALTADAGGPLRGLLESLLGAAQHKAGVFGERVHAAAELATGQKVAAVAASAAALAGGGTAIERLDDQQPPPRAERQVEVRPQKEEAASAPTPAPAPAVESVVPAPQPARVPAPTPPPPPPEPADEFAPPRATATAATATPSPPPEVAPAPVAAETAAPAEAVFAPSAAGSGSGAAGGGEFGP